MMTILAMRFATGVYRTRGGYQIIHDDLEGGTRKWVVLHGPYGYDNPLAFCATLKEAREFITLLLEDEPCRQ